MMTNRQYQTPDVSSVIRPEVTIRDEHSAVNRQNTRTELLPVCVEAVMPISVKGINIYDTYTQSEFYDYRNKSIQPKLSTSMHGADRSRHIRTVQYVQCTLRSIDGRSVYYLNDKTTVV